MFSTIFLFELKSWLKAPATYIYFAVLMALSCLVVLTISGTFESIRIFFAGEKVLANSPFTVDLLISLLSYYMGTIIAVAIIGTAALKDFHHRSHSILFTTSISRFSYMGGKFAASFLISTLVVSGAVFGIMLGFSMPWLDPERIGAFIPMAYIQPMLTTVLPNLFFVGAIVFSLALLVRNIFIVWLKVILLFVVFGVSNSLLGDLDHATLSSLLDSLGSSAKFQVTKYWSIAEKNINPIPLNGIFLLNRIIWCAVGFLILAVAYFKFRFSNNAVQFSFMKKKNNFVTDSLLQSQITFSKINLPKVSQSFGDLSFFKQLIKLSLGEFRLLLRNTYFKIIVLIGIVMLFAISTQIGKVYDTTTYPVTYMVTMYLLASFKLFIVIITIIFSGELIWKSRDNRFNEILDALPVPNWVLYTSKLFTLMFVQTLLLFIVMACGIIIQMSKGFSGIEITQYVKELFGFKLIDFWLLAVLAVTLQIVSNNKYIGFFLAILYYIWDSYFAATVLKHNLLVFGSDPGYVFSEMNGYGHAVLPFVLYKIYWSACAILLAIASNSLWVRGNEDSLKQRIKLIRQRLTPSAKWSGMGAVVVFLSSGGFIFYNNNILNTFKTINTQEKEAVLYEKTYKKYANIPQPKITDVKLNLDLFPYEQSLQAQGKYILKNKTNIPIDSIHVLVTEGTELSKLTFSAEAIRVHKDDDFSYNIYLLKRALQPGDSIEMSFTISRNKKGFKHNFYTSLDVPVYNGTFMNNLDILPSIGYNEGLEIGNNSLRKKFNLPEKPTENPINDPHGLCHNFITDNADFINLEVTVSTAADQIAIAPGYLQREWMHNGRKYFHYKMDSKIINFFSFLSGKFEVKKDNWNDVELAIYYHKGHEYNLDRMIRGIKNSLDYYTANFSPYQHKQVRIIEFPRYASFAQSFPNTIPYSEAIGFIADVEDADVTDKVDYPFYVTAHEVAHQWFAHQLTAADVEGGNVLSETLSQYGALMVMEKEYGKEKTKKFLRYELEKYLMARSNEHEKEKPLVFSDKGQQYILYNKGAVIMYGLKEFIGEEKLNQAISDFLKKNAYRENPYPTSVEFLAALKAVTPDSLQYILKDGFEDIILFDNKIVNASSARTENFEYIAEFTLKTNKLRGSAEGKETEIKINDFVPIAIYSADNELLYYKKHRISKNSSKFRIKLQRRPETVVVDPYFTLIDRNPMDNSLQFKKESNNKLSEKDSEPNI